MLIERNLWVKIQAVALAVADDYIRSSTTQQGSTDDRSHQLALAIRSGQSDAIDRLCRTMQADRYRHAQPDHIRFVLTERWADLAERCFERSAEPGVPGMPEHGPKRRDRERKT